MGKYKIYHIPEFTYADGRVGKIGCTIHWDQRLTANKRLSKTPFTIIELLEEHDDKVTAGIRERALQKQYGYRVDDIQYHKAQYSRMGKVGWKSSRSKYDDMNQRISNGLKENKSVLGERNPSSILTDKDVVEARELFRQGWNIAKLSKRYGIKVYDNMKKALLGITWSHIENPIESITTGYERKIDYEIAKDIRLEYSTTNVTMDDLALKYSCNVGTIKNVLENKSFVDSTYKYKSKKKTLSDSQVIELITLYRSEKYNQRQLCKKYNITPSSVFHIVHRNSYKHICI